MGRTGSHPCYNNSAWSTPSSHRIFILPQHKNEFNPRNLELIRTVIAARDTSIGISAADQKVRIVGRVVRGKGHFRFITIRGILDMPGISIQGPVIRAKGHAF